MMSPEEEEKVRRGGDEEDGGQQRCSDLPSLTFPSVLQRSSVPEVVLTGEGEAVSGPEDTRRDGALQMFRVTFTASRQS